MFPRPVKKPVASPAVAEEALPQLPLPESDPNEAEPDADPDDVASALGGSPKVILPKAMVVYMGSEFGPFRCDNCCNFQQPEACSIVEAPIDPAGCCNLYCPPNHGDEDDMGGAEEPESPEEAQAEGMPEAVDVEPQV